jgi:hypothetical protein
MIHGGMIRRMQAYIGQEQNEERMLWSSSVNMSRTVDSYFYPNRLIMNSSFPQVPPSSEVALQSGDLIGFTLTGTGTIAVNYVSPSDGYRYVYGAASTVPTAGQDYDVTVLTTTGVFSYSIEIGKIPFTTFTHYRYFIYCRSVVFIYIINLFQQYKGLQSSCRRSQCWDLQGKH